jgi:hypothetical protein
MTAGDAAMVAIAAGNTVILAMNAGDVAVE